MISVLVLVDRAQGGSGPHRNVVGSLNALSARDDVQVRLLSGYIDENEPFAASENLECVLGFEPHNLLRVPQNLSLVFNTARGCDIVYVPTNFKSLVYAQVARRLPIVAGPNVSPISKRKDAPGFVELSWMCDLWLEASDFRVNRVLEVAGGRFSGKLKRVHHAIDSVQFSPAHRISGFWQRFGISSRSVKVLYVGRDNHVCKGVRQLVQAVELVNSRGDSSRVDFVFVGRMSEDTREVLGRMKNAHCLGFRGGRELAEICANSDMSVVPSSWENFPFTVTEAMASGVAVIGSKVGGIPEQISDGETGLLASIVPQPGSVFNDDAGETLSAAIVRLIMDEGLRKRLGRNARNRVLEYFNEDRLGAELYETFALVLAR